MLESIEEPKPPLSLVRERNPKRSVKRDSSLSNLHLLILASEVLFELQKMSLQTAIWHDKIDWHLVD